MFFAANLSIKTIELTKKFFEVFSTTNTLKVLVFPLRTTTRHAKSDFIGRKDSISDSYKNWQRHRGSRVAAYYSPEETGDSRRPGDKYSHHQLLVWYTHCLLNMGWGHPNSHLQMRFHETPSPGQQKIISEMDNFLVIYEI